MSSPPGGFHSRCSWNSTSAGAPIARAAACATVGTSAASAGERRQPSWTIVA
jgi:hypothetical protein